MLLPRKRRDALNRTEIRYSFCPPTPTRVSKEIQEGRGALRPNFGKFGRTDRRTLRTNRMRNIIELERAVKEVYKFRDEDKNCSVCTKGKRAEAKKRE